MFYYHSFGKLVTRKMGPSRYLKMSQKFQVSQVLKIKNSNFQGVKGTFTHTLRRSVHAALVATTVVAALYGAFDTIVNSNVFQWVHTQRCAGLVRKKRRFSKSVLWPIPLTAFSWIFMSSEAKTTVWPKWKELEVENPRWRPKMRIVPSNYPLLVRPGSSNNFLNPKNYRYTAVEIGCF